MSTLPQKSDKTEYLHTAFARQFSCWSNEIISADLYTIRSYGIFLTNLEAGGGTFLTPVVVNKHVGMNASVVSIVTHNSRLPPFVVV